MSKSMQSQYQMQMSDRQRQRRNQLIQILLAVAVLVALLMSRPANSERYSVSPAQNASSWQLSDFFDSGY